MENNYTEEKISYLEELDDLVNRFSRRVNSLEKRSGELVGFGRILSYSIEKDVERYSDQK